jgi:glycerol-3-phosphate acyltransferase PlsY
MHYLIISLAGYLLGCSNMAYWLSLIKKVDIRNNGSGNLGASNATVLLGWSAGVIVAVHDIGKAVLAVLLAKFLFPEVEYACAAAGVSCVLGHIFPFYLKFKGGKGLASFLGAVAALNWKVGLAIAVLLVLVTLVTDFISLGTLSVSVAAPLGIFLATGSIFVPLILCIATAVMIVKHIENIHRILNRTEIGLRSTIKGENRAKE